LGGTGSQTPHAKAITPNITTDQLDPWHNTRIIRRADAHAQIAELKRQSGKDILMFGSHIPWNDLLAHGLVDELHLMIGNDSVGAGTPIFAGGPPVALRRIDTRTWDGSENVPVRYEVGRQTT
jgi:dihydrofolate reductase